MRPTSPASVKIENEANRVHSGSVSPPIPAILSMDSMNGKKAFFEKMREMFASDKKISSEDLEKKIEQLWKGLSQTQKEQFILRNTNGSRLNIPKQSKSKKIKKISSQPPMLTRRDNCKAIAKVLDLHSDSPNASRFADTVKNRMVAYTKASNSISARPPASKTATIAKNLLVSAEQLRLAAESVNISLKTVQTAPTVAKIPPTDVSKDPETEIDPATVILPKNPPATARRTVVKRIRPVSQKQVPIRPADPQMSYNEVCRQYYSTLSQASLLYPIELSSLPAIAQIVEGSKIVREYTIHDRL